MSLTGLGVHAPADRQACTGWMTLGFGAALQAVRDDEQAAASLGVRVDTGARRRFVRAAFGRGAAGARILASTRFIDPRSIFGAQGTACLIFRVLVGGPGASGLARLVLPAEVPDDAPRDDAGRPRAR